MSGLAVGAKADGMKLIGGMKRRRQDQRDLHGKMVPPPQRDDTCCVWITQHIRRHLSCEGGSKPPTTKTHLLSCKLELATLGIVVCSVYIEVESLGPTLTHLLFIWVLAVEMGVKPEGWMFSTRAFTFELTRASLSEVKLKKVNRPASICVGKGLPKGTQTNKWFLSPSFQRWNLQTSFFFPGSFEVTWCQCGPDWILD